MARNREFDDALDELKMLHDAKNHDYATAENPYKNLEGVSRIGIEPWRGIVIRLMDKFERVEQYCTNGELAIKSEGMEDTFKDIAVYSTLAMILFRKGQNDEYAKKILSENGYADWEQDGKPPLRVDKHGNAWSKPVDNLDARLDRMKESAEISMNDLREAAEKQQEEEERSNVKILQDKLEAQRQGHLRSKENVSHIQSIQRDANNN